MSGCRRRGIVAGAAVVVTVLLAACGGDDDGTDSADADSADEASGDEASGDDSSGSGNETGGDDSSGSGDAGTAGAGTATVTVDGVTMLFAQIEPGPNDDYYTFCTQISGTLQAVFPQVDESGTVLRGELSVILIEPGSFADDLDEPPEFSVDNGDRFWNYAESDPFDIPADGSSASGTATLVESGAFDPQTGEIQTTPFEASLQISC